MKRSALMLVVAIATATLIGTPASADEIPYCTDTQLAQGEEGIPPAEAAEEADIAGDTNEVECRVAPADVLAVTDVDIPPASLDPWFHVSNPYHFVGWRTVEDGDFDFDYEGVQATLKVVNATDLPHDDDRDQFVAARVMLVKANGAWAEVGWAETDWQGGNDDQYLYTFDTGTDAWHFYNAVNPGSTYIVRARTVAAGNTRLERFNASTDAWQLLDSTNLNCNEDACRAANLTEVYANGAPHPDWSGSIGHTAAKLDQDATSWPAWGAGVPTGAIDDSGYIMCNETPHTIFNAKRGNAC